MSKLTAKQERFCQEYLIDSNGSKAAARAGFSERSAGMAASRMMKNDNIRAKIDELLEKREKEAIVTASLVLKELLLIAKTDIADAYDQNGNLKSIHEIPEDTRRAIAGIKVFEEFEGFGKERKKIGETRELKLWNKPEALELLGRHLKLFTDKVEHSFADGLSEKLIKARKRRNG